MSLKQRIWKQTPLPALTSAWDEPFLHCAVRANSAILPLSLVGLCCYLVVELWALLMVQHCSKGTCRECRAAGPAVNALEEEQQTLVGVAEWDPGPFTGNFPLQVPARAPACSPSWPVATLTSSHGPTMAYTTLCANGPRS